MTRVYLADSKPVERTALRLLLLDLKMDIVGEAADWRTTLDQAPTSRSDMLLVDWDLLPNLPSAALEELRLACPAALVIVLISHLDARQQAALSTGADAFISKGETPDRVAERLRLAAVATAPEIWSADNASILDGLVNDSSKNDLSTLMSLINEAIIDLSINIQIQ